ncbi:ABC transporter ATP-binding protein [Streptomyces sp. NBC_01304]|uniref:ABC transporter ATP-binding protein n=1 Tax=Streptomyces sp. NBC_01304 TaxID=2903818 RepID=UPI002E146080|nr:ABC transporter ATP-binding protein/permease [Streptomyces sp. NBC_01304]
MTAARVELRHCGAAFTLAREAAPAALALYTVLSLATGLLPVAVAWLTKQLLDGLVAGAPGPVLLAHGGGIAAAGLVMGVLPHATGYLRAELERRVGLLAQDRLFAAVDGFQGLARFEDPQFLDRLRLAKEAGRMSPNQAVDGVLGVLRSTATVTGFLGTLLLVSPLMAALVLGAGVPVLLAEVALSRRRARMFWDIGPAERRETFYSELLGTVAAAKEVRLFGIGSFLRTRMLTERRTANRARRRTDLREVRVQSLLGVLAAAVSGAGLVWSVRVAQSGTLSVGDVTVFVAAVAGVQGALTAMAGEVARSHQALLMFEHYAAVTTAGTDLPVREGDAELAPLRGEIEFRDVAFRYSDDHPWVLHGLNLRIPCGSSVALVGLNGAGKSTLVKLLCRFYDPTHGAVLWDGVDLRDIHPAVLRRRIGAVFQDFMHYDLTAAENIALGDLDALDDRDRIRQAAERAGAHPRITALPRGYDTLLSRMFHSGPADDPDTGVELSGGQWQRLALARAFLRDRRDLMILDEPSAGLDAAAEHEIHTALRRHREGRTSLLISHRLGAVREADHIVVLAAGEITEQGDHEELMRLGGEYARLFTLQAQGYGSASPAPADSEPDAAGSDSTEMVGGGLT